MTYRDNENVSGDTPLSYNLSMPSWLVNKQLGINGLCKQGWRHRKCPSQNVRERFKYWIWTRCVLRQYVPLHTVLYILWNEMLLGLVRQNASGLVNVLLGSSFKLKQYIFFDYIFRDRNCKGFRGHSITTGTEFCDFFARFLAVFIPWAWTKTDIFWPPSPSSCPRSYWMTPKMIRWTKLRNATKLKAVFRHSI